MAKSERHIADYSECLSRKSCKTWQGSLQPLITVNVSAISAQMCCTFSLFTECSESWRRSVNVWWLSDDRYLPVLITVNGGPSLTRYRLPPFLLSIVNYWHIFPVLSTSLSNAPQGAADSRTDIATVRLSYRIQWMFSLSLFAVNISLLLITVNVCRVQPSEQLPCRFKTLWAYWLQWTLAGNADYSESSAEYSERFALTESLLLITMNVMPRCLSRTLRYWLQWMFWETFLLITVNV